MSVWDKCCRSGKFNANFAKKQRNAETFRKINPCKENEASVVSETSDEVSVSYSYTNKPDESFSTKRDVTNVETQFSFIDLGLNPHLLKYIEYLGFSLPNRVQNEVLYRLSEGRAHHSVIISPKNSGKTSAALLWVLNKLISDKDKEYPKALMICPKYEIAERTYRFAEQVSNYCEIKIYSSLKGKKLSKGEQLTADLVIATPDKALELSKSSFNLKNAKYLILDDAHCLSDSVGHLKTLSHVCSLLSSRCTIILCTLLCNKVLEDFIDKFLYQNQRIEIENVIIKVPPKEVFIVYCNNEERFKAFLYLEKSYSYGGQTVIFCKTKDELNRLKKMLDAENVSVEILNGNLKPASRRDVSERFIKNEIKLLITTYAYLEALKAENLCKVINYEQVLDNEYALDHNTYGQIENELNGKKNCLISSFIEQKWEDALLKSQPGLVGEQVYPNATKISAKDLIDGENF